MNWHEFCRTNMTLVLTLPGAALASIPVGAFTWYWIRYNVGITGPGDALFDTLAGPAAWVLIPVSAVCSTLAVTRLVERRDGHLSPASVLVGLFNFSMAMVTGFVTAIVGVHLAARVAGAIF
jgi:hypothetical protein